MKYYEGVVNMVGYMEFATVYFDLSLLKNPTDLKDPL
jgi:hypothetical protein